MVYWLPGCQWLRLLRPDMTFCVVWQKNRLLRWPRRVMHLYLSPQLITRGSSVNLTGTVKQRTTNKSVFHNFKDQLFWIAGSVSQFDNELHPRECTRQYRSQRHSPRQKDRHRKLCTENILCLWYVSSRVLKFIQTFIIGKRSRRSVFMVKLNIVYPWKHLNNSTGLLETTSHSHISLWLIDN